MNPLPCPDCHRDCAPWTITGRAYYVECHNEDCPRYMVTKSVEEWLGLSATEIQSQRCSHIDYASARLAGLDATLKAIAHCAKMVEAARAGDFQAYQALVVGVPPQYRHRVFLDNCPVNYEVLSHKVAQHWRWKEITGR